MNGRALFLVAVCALTALAWAVGLAVGFVAGWTSPPAIFASGVLTGLGLVAVVGAVVASWSGPGLASVADRRRRTVADDTTGGSTETKPMIPQRRFVQFEDTDSRQQRVALDPAAVVAVYESAGGSTEIQFVSGHRVRTPTPFEEVMRRLEAA